MRRSARRPEDVALATDAALIRQRLGASGPLPLDVQLAVVLGEEAIARWESTPMSPSVAAWFAGELALLASPRARALAERVRPTA